MNRTITFTLIFLFIAFIFSISLTPLRSTNDAWWHLKSGRMFILNGLRLPENDIFAYTSESLPWHNHEWLAQFIFYVVYQLGDGTEQSGIQMVILFKALVLLATYLLVFGLAYRETKNVPIAVLVSMWALLLARRTIYPRPPILSYMFFAGFIFLLHENAANRLRTRWLWALPVAMILWVNLHGGFLLGIIAVGAYLLAEILKAFFAHQSIRSTRIPLYAALIFSCIIASLVNPYTYQLYLLPGRVMKDIHLVRVIPELHSPDFFFTISFEVLIIFLVVAFAIARKKVLSLAEGFLIVFFLHQALQHVRHLPLVGIVAAPVCVRLISTLVEEYLPVRLRRVAPALIGAFVVLIAAYSIFNHREGESYYDRNRNFFAGMGYYANRYPVLEANFIIANKFTGRMFNQINDAGYLIWRLSPEYHKVFTDSRYDIFGGKFMRQQRIIEAGLDRKVSHNDWTWDELLDRWRANFILITADAPVNELLEESGRWQLVYHRIPPRARSAREGYKIYVRNIPPNKELIERCRRSFAVMTSMQ